MGKRAADNTATRCGNRAGESVGERLGGHGGTSDLLCDADHPTSPSEPRLSRLKIPVLGFRTLTDGKPPRRPSEALPGVNCLWLLETRVSFLVRIAFALVSLHLVIPWSVDGRALVKFFCGSP